ncbi:mRNA turnover protein 4-like protein [Trichinella spiralis]|uniref:mRNA turnover protein 4-like protein n=1 Tax=Trichinella spiralis TaxID=6334 RepID=UPI0001EFBD2B|nr:mRNA turnover protein 4-like protein [Trichinella spiralis]
MPRSKRDKEVSLTVVKKKGREGKENVFCGIVSNSSNEPSQACFQRKQSGKFVQIEFNAGWSTWTDVLQFVCRRCNKVRTAVEIVHAFAALLCRNLKKLEQPEFARSGNKATETITIPAGPLEQFQFTIEPLLRKLGLPVTLEKGNIFPFVVIDVFFIIRLY